MTIKEFDKRTVRDLNEDVRVALEAVAEKHGLKLERKMCTYDSLSCPTPFRFNIVSEDSDGNEVTPLSEAFKARASHYGMEPDWLFQTFTANGRTYKIVGLKPRNKKYPVIAEEMGRGLIKMTAVMVKTYMKPALTLTSRQMYCLRVLVECAERGDIKVAVGGRTVKDDKVPKAVVKELVEHKFALLHDDGKQPPTAYATMKGREYVADDRRRRAAG